MNLTSTRYAFLSAYVKGEEARSVQGDHISVILQRARTTQDVLELIRDTDAGETLREETWKTYPELEECLWKTLSGNLDRIRRFTLPEGVGKMIRVFLNRFDILNIKLALRAVHEEKPFSPVPLGSLSEEDLLDELSRVKSVPDLLSHLRAAGLGEYGDILSEVSEIDEKSILDLERVLDGFYNEQWVKTLGGMDEGTLLVRVQGIFIDYANLRTVFRLVIGGRGAVSDNVFLKGGHLFDAALLREFLSLSPGEIVSRLADTEYEYAAQDLARGVEKGKSVGIVDQILDRYLYRTVRYLLAPRAMSPCALLWYLIIKELEIRNLRMIFKVLYDGVPVEGIRDFMVIAT